VQSTRAQETPEAAVASAAAGQPARVTGEATYLFLYPNFVVNRYGPWMDTNLTLPVSERECVVLMDYFLDESALGGAAAADARAPEYARFVQSSLEASAVVQKEDVFLCETVQRGLESCAYDVGRYAPNVEHAMHDFHATYHDDMEHAFNAVQKAAAAAAAAESEQKQTQQQQQK
jgi:choline monooxygenase